jgi:hypothetical protein
MLPDAVTQKPGDAHRDNDAMHLLIPFAAPLSEAGRQAGAALQLPHLQGLLNRLTEVQRDTGDEWTLSPPHERALAQSLGWSGADGQLPWAARAAKADGLPVGTQAWGLLTPAHWHVGTDQVSLADPDSLMLDEASARQLFDVVQGQFSSEGFAVSYVAPTRWYLSHDSLRNLPTASLDRVIGRNVDAWLGKQPAMHLLRRLQSEVQMLLYTHPLNDARVARGLLPVNSFWLSGCGVLQPTSKAQPQIDARLRAPALADDWAAWCKAWDTLDAGPLAALLAAVQDKRAVRLTLCGERAWVAFENQPRSWLQRAKALVQNTAVQPLMESL